MDQTSLRRNLLHKLYHGKKFEKGHLLGEHLCHGIPSHLRGEAHFIAGLLLLGGAWVQYRETRKR